MIKKFCYRSIVVLFVVISTLSCDRFKEEELVVKITPSSLQMRVGETAEIIQEVSPESAPYSAELSVANVIDLDTSNDQKKVKVTAIGVGEALYAIEFRGKRAECKITVTE